MKLDIFKKMGSSIGKLTNRTGLKIRKNSPEILMACGILGVGGTVVLACKATLHAEEVLDRHNHRMEQAKEAEEVAIPEDNYDVTKEKVAIYMHTVVDFIKLYGPAVALGIFSITMILTSHNILKKRYLGVVAAYNAVSSAFDIYRKRVKEELGDDVDRCFRYGTHKEIIEEAEIDEKGKEKKIQKEVEVTDNPIFPSDYAKYFDKDNPNWDSNPAFNLMFLKAQQNMANDILQTKGHIFLNEVYDMLGFEHTQVGAVTGWVLGDGDDYVDFGLYDQDRDDVRRFINGKENVVLLDFNVSGVIWDKI